MTEASARDGAELIELVEVQGDGGSLWHPIVGPETRALLEHLKIPEESRSTLESEACQILGRCVRPDAASDRRTGLVVGYVQSGKTMSFTTVTALARDNGYRMVIVIAGISKPLLNQSVSRLRGDLRIDSREDRQWLLFTNPVEAQERSLSNALGDWEDDVVPDTHKRTVLIVVMKNHLHLSNLSRLLARVSLTNVPTLIVDDEADQAGLNTRVNQDDESTTYRRLLELRRQIPNHTFLQYTATPQAPLLINIIDRLSPEFAEVLSPGPNYVGGKELFLESRNLVREIPAGEIPRPPRGTAAPPPSLVESLRLFILGVAAGFAQAADGPGNRSMLIHPSEKRAFHRVYLGWVNAIKDHWLSVLELDPGDPDRIDLVTAFEESYADLLDTVDDLPSFEELLRQLPRALRGSRVLEVNASRGQTPQVDWRSDYGHILVGGQAMDRGFTVEGLTVTYMPRPTGGGNADTVQQRARFFGYKRQYLGYCRVFLEPGAFDAYSTYVRHEEDIRARLEEWETTNKPLSEWKRQFLMPDRLRPTRSNVLSQPYNLGSLSNEWISLGAPHDSEEALEANWQVVHEYLETVELDTAHALNGDTAVTQHLYNPNVSLQEAYEQLLTRIRVTRLSDSERFTGLLLLIQNCLESSPSETCTVIQMSSAGGQWLVRHRALTEKDEIQNLFQGASPPNGPRQGETYRGDRYIGDRSRIVIQLHRNALERDGSVVADDVPNVAVWLPASIGGRWVSQQQAAQNSG